MLILSSKKIGNDLGAFLVVLAPAPKSEAPLHSACHAGSKDGSHFILRRGYLISGKFLISAITDKKTV